MTSALFVLFILLDPNLLKSCRSVGRRLNVEFRRKHVAVITTKEPRTQANISQRSNRRIDTSCRRFRVRTLARPPCGECDLHGERSAEFIPMLMNECQEDSPRGSAPSERNDLAIWQQHRVTVCLDLQSCSR